MKKGTNYLFTNCSIPQKLHDILAKHRDSAKTQQVEQ